MIRDWRKDIGPWNTEGDVEKWVENGMPCLAMRNLELGFWCGYVGVEEGHWAYQRDYDYVYAEGVDVDVHGGLTYAGWRDVGSKVWYLGFDCGHYGDTCPGLWEDGEYRTLDYVKQECRKLVVTLHYENKSRTPEEMG